MARPIGIGMTQKSDPKERINGLVYVNINDFAERIAQKVSCNLIAEMQKIFEENGYQMPKSVRRRMVHNGGF